MINKLLQRINNKKNTFIPKIFSAMFRKTLLSLILILFLTSCTSKKNLIYFQNIDSYKLNSNKYESVLQPDDLLTIIVRGETPEAVAPYNMPNITYIGSDERTSELQKLFTYLIDNEGNINFPSIGKVKVGGLTRLEAENFLIQKLSLYITNPKIDVRILNYKISVQGEVNKPGTFPISSERITLLEAISLAGDLTVYGKRNNVLVLRENNGEKTVQRVDLTKADFMNSPYYYLHQNDVVYVEPNKTKINSAVVGPNIGIVLSGVSLLVTILALTIK